jgi:signal transduction histidine kinase
MFLKKTFLKWHHTLALRLTIWYAGIFALSSLLAFTLVYLLMVTIVQQRADEDLQEDIEEYAGFMRLDGLDKVKEEMAFETQGEEARTDFFRLWTRDGRLMAATDLSSWPGLSAPGTELLRLLEEDEPILETLQLPEREHSVRSIHGAIGPDVVLQIGESLENDEEFLAALLKGFLVALLAVITLGGPIGWFMARRALRGVEEVTCTAMEIADGALNQRVAVGTQGDELDRLAQAFNTMLDRIQALILGMREMTDNLAHDLRSPVARIRASAEMALTNSESRTDWAALASDTTEECDRLLELINTTLDIAEAESGAARLRISEVDLVAIVIDACDLFQTIAEDRKIALHTDLPLQCLIQGDLQRLQRVVANLLDNALKYTLAGGQVLIRLVDEEQRVYLSMIDTGVGISVEESPKIFQRFYRCDWSRSEYGNGLGLSLALAFVRAHGGDINVRSTPGKGSTFTVVLSRLRRGL